MTWYVVLRSGGGETVGRHGGKEVVGRPWTTVSSVLFTDPDEALDFAGKLDHGRAYRLEPIEGGPVLW